VTREARPPLWFWCLPALVTALRMVPLLSLRFAAPPPGRSFLGISYLPVDFLQYAAFSRQVVADGAFLFANPFTTEPQSPRFLLLFHWAVGLAGRITGLPVIDVFEWSRVPLIFGFFATLWWFLRPILPDPRDRLAAAVLAGFAGGLESFVSPLASAWLPNDFYLRFRADTWMLNGWSVSASFYNPLWTAGLTLALLVLRPLLFSPERSRRALATSGAAFALLFFVHPYTAIGVGAIAATSPLLTRLARERLDRRRQLVNAAVLGSALVVIGGISLWQLQDPVYRRSTGGVFGPQNVSALWYPLTLGLLGALAALGARRWVVARHPARAPIFGWIAAVALLHWLPFLNGYKFVFLLPLPVCILAAPVAREWLGQLRAAAAWRRGPALIAGVALFGGALVQTVAAVRSTQTVGSVPSDLMGMVRLLERQPVGNALVPAGLGNILPAFTSHRVWAGHPFLTPNYFARAALLERFASDPAAAQQLGDTLRTQRIRYLVVPARSADRLEQQLGLGVAQRRRLGRLQLLVLEPAPR
jgi:hypothetical protein